MENKENVLNFGEVKNKNYGKLLVALFKQIDISKYTFAGIEGEIDKFISLLNVEDQYILISKFGLETGKPKSCEEIAKDLSNEKKHYSEGSMRILVKSALRNLESLIRLNTNKKSSMAVIGKKDYNFKFNEHTIATNVLKEIDKYERIKPTICRMADDDLKGEKDYSISSEIRNVKYLYELRNRIITTYLKAISENLDKNKTRK